MASTYQVTGISKTKPVCGSLPPASLREWQRKASAGEEKLGAPALQHAPRVLPPSEMKTPIPAGGRSAETRPKCPVCARVCEGSSRGGVGGWRQKGGGWTLGISLFSPPPHTHTHTHANSVFKKLSFDFVSRLSSSSSPRAGRCVWGPAWDTG